MKLRGPSNNDYVDRDCKPKAMVFTERDGRILEHIHQYDGFLADYQVLELEFQGVRQTKMRLGKLFHNGYLVSGAKVPCAVKMGFTKQPSSHTGDRTNATRSV
jgi:hypothetical protein